MKYSIDVLKNKDFLRLLFNRMFVLMALQAQAVIIGWQIYSLTKDPFMLGLTGLVEAVPAITGALFAGYLVDQGRPYSIFLVSVGLLVVNTFYLLLVAGGFVSLDSATLLISLFVAIFLSGLFRCFIAPASFALLPEIVLRSQISSASAWLSSGFQLGAVLGPALAGLLTGFYGFKIAWFLPFGLMLSAFFFLLAMGASVKTYSQTQNKEKAWTSIRAGWQFILKNPTLLSIMSLDMFAVLFGGAVAMLPAYADQVLKVGSEGLGLMRAAPAIGAIFVAIYLALFPMQIMRAKTLLIVVAGFGLCMIGFGLSPYFTLSLLFLAGSGAFDSVSMVIRNTMVQLLTPDSMRGRVSSVNSMFIISSNELGSFESGLSARLMGLVPSVVFGGGCTLFVVLSTAWLSPSFRKAEVKSG